MYNKSKIDRTHRTQSMFHSLYDLLNQQHPLYLLSDKIDWQLFEDKFSIYYCKDNGRPAKSIRLMCGLLILKHIRNLSDESIVERWSENAYYQYFCGEDVFVAKFPCNATELVHFRKRIGSEGIELILQESIRVNDDDTGACSDLAFIDSTVQEKHITYPTDAKMHKKSSRNARKLLLKKLYQFVKPTHAPSKN